MSSDVYVVTGANGFIGRSLCKAFSAQGRQVREVVRKSKGAGEVAVGSIGPDTDWSNALTGASTLVHLAARVHVMRDDELDPLEAYRVVNVDGTRHLAEQAAAAGVRRFVFVSSIKVNGESTVLHTPFRPTDAPAPADAYGKSKAEAEAVLSAVAARTGMELVIVRPPLVYGRGMKGNFARILQLVGKGIPLPFASVNNLRSIVSLDNLVDLLARCSDHPHAGGQTFLVSDGNDMSTPGLIRELARAMNRKARLFSVPPKLLKACGRALGRTAEVDRLINSLQVDISYTCDRLDWRPPLSIAKGLRQACT